MLIDLVRVIVFLSSFLLFQIELIIGKILLPNFGGSFMVWGACMVFFQAVLCLGYKYAEVVLRRLGIARYRRLHVILLFLPLLSFPGHDLPLRHAMHGIPMVFDVFLTLCKTIGPVFFVLSTASIVWQVWLGESTLKENKDPYTLFAVSNMGSFVALLTYPFFVEPRFDLITQQAAWRGMYFVLIFLQVLALWKIPLAAAQGGPALNKAEAATAISGWCKAQWVLFSAGGVIMFMAATNIVTMEIAPVPLLWIIPLSLYLLAFVLAFKKNMWGADWLDKNIHLVMGFAAVHFLFVEGRYLALVLDMGVVFLITFIICLHAQRRLRQLKPQSHRQLPEFYYWISVGGFLGGAMTSWAIPVLFDFLAEYFLAFVLICFANGAQGRQFQKVRIVGFVVIAMLMFYFYPYVFDRITVLGVLALIAWGLVLFQVMHFQKHGVVIILLCMMAMMTLFEGSWTGRNIIYKNRNYYGIHTIYHEHKSRKYMHGTTMHGLQPTSEKYRAMPTSYFGVKSPVGKLLTSEDFKFKKIAMLGLGIGTLTTYLKGDQETDIFELDTLVIKLAKGYFTYLDNARGEIRMHVGDARIQLEKIEKKYDLIIVDVFSGDAIPEHLMTREALSLYREKLAEDGVVLIHVSNRYLKFGPPLLGTSRTLGAHILHQREDGEQPFTSQSVWVALTWDDKAVDLLMNKQGWHLPDAASYKNAMVWSDKYTSISSIINKTAFQQYFFNGNVPWY